MGKIINMSADFAHQETLTLHKLVFNNDISGVSKYVNRSKSTQLADQLDQHGNTPLHLAVMLGHKECVQILLKHNHTVNVKNIYGWTPLHESISYGDRQTITSLFRAIRKQNKTAIKHKKPEIRRALEAIGGNFSLEMKWDFQSWIPFVSKILPSDICKIYRKGSRIRLDSTLEDFSDMRWIRGDVTFLVNFDTEGEPDIVLMDNRRKVYQRMQQSSNEREASIEDEVDVAMSSDIIDVAVKSKASVIERVSSGWFFRHEKTEKIGRFEADFYRISGLLVQTRKRREHLSEEDIRRNKSLRDAFKHAENTEKFLEESVDEEPERRKSLPAPEGQKMSWDQYHKSLAASNPCLGRYPREKINQKQFDPVVGLSADFPVRLEDLLPILEALGPKGKMFSKLKDFIKLRLPPGFPVRVDLPIFPAVKATVSFTQFQFSDALSDSMFDVPRSYKEDCEWFEKTAKEKQQEMAKLNSKSGSSV
uniref:Ankyrin repeat domain-containing protein 13C-like n=1 Tax=Phallusia mammillata TaxID=59560 RepID=A0A6F9D5P7_9ASCI|nr:ankyrin repeat domain-containing protein 13C-like [Phallusia mammillata]